MAVHLIQTNNIQWANSGELNSRSKGAAFNEPPSLCPPDCTPAVVQAFIEKINHDAMLTVECNICALVYAIRFLKCEGAPSLTRNNWRPILSTAFLIASKVWDDLSMLNRDFSIIFARTTSLAEVNTRETMFLKAVGWEVNVSASQYTDLYFRLREYSNLKRVSQFSQEVQEAHHTLEATKKRRVDSADCNKYGDATSTENPFSPRAFGRSLDLNSPRQHPFTAR
jgi:hypothetical protein